MEVICAILEEKYHVEAEIKEPTVIYMERPLGKAEYTIHIEVPPNPFWDTIGLSVEPLPLGSGVQYESRVSLGYLNQSFQNAVMQSCVSRNARQAALRLVNATTSGRKKPTKATQI